MGKINYRELYEQTKKEVSWLQEQVQKLKYQLETAALSQLSLPRQQKMNTQISRVSRNFGL